MGRSAEGAEAARRAVDLYRELLAAAPADTGRRLDVARACNGLGVALDKANRPDEALGAFREGVGLLEGLARDHPGEASYLHSLAGQHHNAGMVYQDTLGKPRETRAAFRTALELEEQAAAKAPYDVGVQEFLAKHVFSLGVVHDVGLKEPAPALQFFERSAALREKLVRENPAVHEFRGELALSYRSIGRLRRIRGEREPAARAFDQALALLERVVADQPASPDFRNTLGLTYTSLGHLRYESGDLAEAAGCHRRAVEVQERLARDHPERLVYRSHLVPYLGNLASVYSVLDQLDDARRTVGRARPFADAPRRRGYQAADYARAPALLQALSDSVDQRVARAEEDLGRARQSLAVERARLPAAPGVAARARLLGLLSRCFAAEWMLGRKEDALRSMQAALELAEGLVTELPDEVEYRHVRVACHLRAARAHRDLWRPGEALAAARATGDGRRWYNESGPGWSHVGATPHLTGGAGSPRRPFAALGRRLIDHRRSVWSCPVLASVMPSREQATAWTSAVWPSRVPSDSPVRTSQRSTFPSAPPAATTPFDTKATERTACRSPRSSATRSPCSTPRTWTFPPP
jgi:tetratricopeptide (TPR) repeat protein